MNDGFGVVEEWIGDGFVQVGKRWVYVEVEGMGQRDCKSLVVYEERDGEIDVNVVFVLKFFGVCVEF